jgi:sigma-E factor negative regulatory protein RseB
MRPPHAALPLTLFLLLIGADAGARSATAPAPAHAAGAPLAMLQKIQHSARTRNYTGTFIYEQGGAIRTSRITHVWDGRNELEKLELLDGSPREFIRRNEQVVSYDPAARTRHVEQRVSSDLFPAVLASSGADLSGSYTVKLEGASRVAGHDAQGLALLPRDPWRYGYRLWADKRTGLLLRMQTLGAHGETIEQIAFTELAMNGVTARMAAPSYPDAVNWRADGATQEAAAAAGWQAAWLPPGFRKIREVKRLVIDSATPISGEKSPRPSEREVSQIVYSDGLAGISVFIEPKGQHRSEGSVSRGAVNIVGKRYGDFWLTIVGEVPAAAVRKIAESIQYKPSSDPSP